MEFKNYFLKKENCNLSLEVAMPSQELIEEKWQEILSEVSGHKVTDELTSYIEHSMAEWVISEILVTSEFEVK